jgi:hypothetical protein
MSTHTPGAMRAAKQICDAGYCGTYDFVAEIVDREIGVKEILRLLEATLPYVRSFRGPGQMHRAAAAPLVDEIEALIAKAGGE